MKSWLAIGGVLILALLLGGCADIWRQPKVEILEWHMEPECDVGLTTVVGTLRNIGCYLEYITVEGRFFNAGGYVGRAERTLRDLPPGGECIFRIPCALQCTGFPVPCPTKAEVSIASAQCK